MKKLGPYQLNRVHTGDCLELAKSLPPDVIDVLVTSPPYWGQRLSSGVGVEEDPREYLAGLTRRFVALLPALKPEGIVWINLGDAYNTPVNWRRNDYKYSSLGPDGDGLAEDNSAYIKPRLKRKAYLDKEAGWLSYGNLLALPFRLIDALCECGFLYRGEVIWQKKNPMPEGRCRRPHRGHEGIYLFAKSEQHQFRVSPPVKSVWNIASEGPGKVRHYSRFPLELPTRCIEAYGQAGPEVVVLDPFSGSGTTGVAACNLGCSYLGFEIDAALVRASNKQLSSALAAGNGSAAVRGPQPED